MQIYSVTSVDQETGDLDGYELAIDRHRDSTVDAWLYVYESAPNDDAIHISGFVSGPNLSLRGNWAEHQIEYPSKKEIVQTHIIEMEGLLDPASFRGTLKIEGLYTPAQVHLKRVILFGPANPSCGGPLRALFELASRWAPFSSDAS